jgi:hypothetical protein
VNPEHFARSDLDDLIDRASAALSVSGVEIQDVVDVMVEDGVEPGDAILAAHAAAILVRTREWLEEHGKEYEENRAVFHGSTRAFAPERARPMEGSYGPGIYFTSKEFRARKFAQEGGQIISCDITLQNPVDYFAYLSGPDEYINTSEKVRESWSPMERVMKWALSAATSLYPDASPEEVAAAQERGRLKSELLTMLGYDGIVVDFSHPNATVPRTASKDEVYYVLFSLYGKNCKVVPQ